MFLTMSILAVLKQYYILVYNYMYNTGIVFQKCNGNRNLDTTIIKKNRDNSRGPALS